MSNTYENGHYGRGTAAGSKGKSQTGKDAAEHVNRTLGRRHQQMMEAWTFYGAAGAIPETIANDLDLPVHLVRPRAGELVKLGRLFVVGRSPGELGCKVMRYSVEKPAEPEAQEVEAA